MNDEAPTARALNFNDGAELRRVLWCSFCGNGQDEPEAAVLIAGPTPRPSFICDKCVDVCAEMIEAARVARRGVNS